MGTNISVSLPPVENSNLCGSIGDVRLSRSMYKDCVNVGIPLDSMEDGIFEWDPSPEELERVLCATQVQIRSIHAQLDRGEGHDPRGDCPWGTSNYNVACYLQEWEALMQTAHELRIRDIKAAFFGA
jgi:hypothetical protein